MTKTKLTELTKEIFEEHKKQITEQIYDAIDKELNYKEIIEKTFNEYKGNNSIGVKENYGGVTAPVTNTFSLEYFKSCYENCIKKERENVLAQLGLSTKLEDEIEINFSGDSKIDDDDDYGAYNEDDDYEE